MAAADSLGSHTDGTPPSAAGFDVPRWLDWLGAQVQRHPRFWIALGRLETQVLEQQLRPLRIDRPIYISGLARCGSTILLETLARHAQIATHAYRDFPAVYTPYFWNWFVDRARRSPPDAVERAHGDGIRVTPDSPEALEEVLWMGFFPGLHDVHHSAVLGADTEAPRFEAFYRDHLRKLLWLRGGRRYLCKGNYNITRLEYLLKLFPDARIVVPVRAPAAHIESLMRQHARFCRLHLQDPKALRYMQRAGHFEFGLDRRVVVCDRPEESARIMACWREGREIEGWARAWNDLHRFLADRLDASPALRQAVHIVRYDTLCTRPQSVLSALYAHCELEVDANALSAAAERLRAPDYYRSSLDQRQRATIAALTDETAARLGLAA